MDLVAVMDTYAKRATSPNIFGMPLLSFISWIIFLHLNPEVRRFSYSGMRWEECKSTSCSSPLGESSVATSRLKSVGFFSPLWWLTWWLYPTWRFPYLVKGIGVSDLAFVTCSGSGSSVVIIEVACGEGPAAISWESASRGYYFQVSLNRGMIEDSLR